ncbi:FAD-linked oxidoreductase [Nadsonia fulvescens var. elongata DSM 6958]|uniref:Proline dehydrogenase n=1 Tax=Nadsonia fulvescens var. elongata DSM 6958 TaxID=857566 RepID=A0A1E3PJX2_9ASCO|nr:FAD-linked oxidoreductase [Nadsonia fulvescens var. elongata DSM 6958]
MLSLQTLPRSAARSSSLALTQTAFRRFIQQSTNKSNAIVSNADVNPQPIAPQSRSPAPQPAIFNPNIHILTPGASPQFVQKMSTGMLSSFLLISLMSSNRLLLKLVTKAIPYTPSFLIKSLVFPHYCGGEYPLEVVQTGRDLNKRGFGNMMISYSVEDAEGGATSAELMENALEEIIASIDNVLVKYYDTIKLETGKAIPGYIALKPTGLVKNGADIILNYNNPAYAQRWSDYLDVCRRICSHAATSGKGKVVIVFDAEKKTLQPGVYEAQKLMMREFNRDGQVVVMGTIQMYLQDSLAQLESDIADAKEHNYQLGLKLVRGAYTHSEPDRWNVIHKTKADSDLSYNTGMNIALDSIISGWKDTTKPAVIGKLVVASHNEESMAIAKQKLSVAKDVMPADQQQVVFAQLMGMAEDLGEELSKTHNVVKYIPWGPVPETKQYLVRRLEENGDTVSMVGWDMAKVTLNEFARRMGAAFGLAK